MVVQQKFNVFARHESSGHQRNFLIEAPDPHTAKAVFLVDRVSWEPEICRPARCFVNVDVHGGELSVWEGKEGRTAILCQFHGENLP